MELWWRAAGYARLGLTSADWPGRLRLLTDAGIRLERIRAVDDLTVEFSVRSRDYPRAAALLQKRGEEPRLLDAGGLPQRIKGWIRSPLILFTLVLITAATLWLPGRILRIDVTGNGDIPARRILQTAADSGVCFGAARRDIRSEQVKNALLEQIPELSWAGVNTSGCRAVITVRVRDETDRAEENLTASSVVAVRDAVVTDISVTSGTALCAPGQTVTAGQVLISGFTDLGLCTRAEPASGEVWGLTGRVVRAVVPDTVIRAEQTGEIVEKYSLLLGKKRINFHSDSGILYETCGKMRKVIWLTLPGGWRLPAALVVERYDLTQCHAAARMEPEALLTDAAMRAVTAEMIAGEILQCTAEASREGTIWVLEARYECSEMIGRLRQGVYLEGETNDDRENGERGTG